MTTWAQARIDAWANKAIEDLCRPGASLPGGSAGGAISLIGADDDVGKQHDRYHEERISDSRIGQEILNSYISNHNDLLLSESHNAKTKLSIPNGTFAFKSFKYWLSDAPVNPEPISTIPNQPEERLNNIADSPSRNVLREQSITIDSKSSTGEQNVSTDHGFFLLRPPFAQGFGVAQPVYAADGPVGAGGCTPGVGRFIKIAADGARIAVVPPVVSIVDALWPDDTGGGESVAKSITESVADTLREAAEKLEDDCGGKPSAFGILFTLSFVEGFRAGGSHEENNDQSQHEKNGIEQIRDSEGIIHRDTFSANNKLALQQMSVAVIPTSIAATSGLSTEVKSGVTTPTAKNTVPALSQILESRSNCNTGPCYAGDYAGIYR